MRLERMSVNSTGQLVSVTYSLILAERLGPFVPFQVATPK